MAKAETFGSDLKIPKEIKPIFVSIYEELIWINAQWKFYTDLFVEKKDRKLISSTARTFFMSIEQVIRFSVILGICHLADPAVVAKRDTKLENLSLENLVNKCPSNESITSMFSDFKEQSACLNKWRNKVIAHSDLETILHTKKQTLPPVNHEEIQKPLKLAGQVMQIIYNFYDDRKMTLGFEPIISHGTDSLKFWLTQGFEAYHLRLKLLKEGRLPEDLG